MNILLDTAAWINGVKEPETLPAKALAILRNEDNRFFLSDISLLEASTLNRKGKVDFGMKFPEWLALALAENLSVLPISARVIAVEKPMQYSVLRTSLSIVLGMAMTLTPSLSRRAA